MALASTSGFRPGDVALRALAASCVAIVCVLMDYHAHADEPAAAVVITDTKGKETSLTKITTTQFTVQVGNSTSAVPLERIVRIDSVVPGKKWRITQTAGAPVEGQISGSVVGEWALGTYLIEMSNISTIVFPNRKQSDKPSQGVMARAKDAKGANVDLTAISTKSFALQVGPATATVVLDQVAEIERHDDKDSVWQVRFVDAPPLDGRVSGDLEGEWALGKYSAKLDQLTELSFPGRTSVRSWPEKSAPAWTATLTLVGGVDLRASSISMVPRALQYSYGDQGGAQHIERSILVVLRHGGADLLIDLRKVAKIGGGKEQISIELLDGTTYEGVLSDAYSLAAETTWGKITFPNSAIASATFTPDRLTIGIDGEAEKKISKLFEQAVFPGRLLTKEGKEFPIDAFLIEYSNRYSYYSTAGYIIGGQTYSGNPHFAAIKGLPCKVGDSCVDIEPGKIQALTVSAGSDSPRRLQITAVGGTNVEATLADNKSPEGLTEYHASQGSNYCLVGVLARTNVGYLRIGIDALKGIRRATE